MCQECKVKREKKYIKDIPEFIVSVHNKEDLEKGYTHGSTIQIDFDCPKCGSVYKQYINSFYKGSRCGYCRGLKVNETNYAYSDKEMYDASVDKEILKQFTVCSRHINKWRCEKCGHIYKSKFSTFKNGSRCPCCCSCSKVANETNYAYSDKEMYDASVDKEILKNFTCGSKTKNKWLCNCCKQIYQSTFLQFKWGNRCPKCKESKGEKFISKFLTENKIEHKKQYRFKDCKNKRPLPFDCAIMKENTISGLIEFHGVQHEKINNFFGGEKELIKRQLNDSIKERYCKDNNIPLLIIWHYDNIEEKLKTFLNALGINN